MVTRTLYSKLSLALEEKDVDNAYADAFMKAYKIKLIEHPFKCDGYIEDIFQKLIIEYKFDENFSLPTARAKVLVQVLFYLKQFEINGRELPSVIFVGDKNECFVLHSNSIIDYLDKSIDWSEAPSKAADANPELVLEIARDGKINPYVYDITSEFHFSDVIARIHDLSENVKRYVRVTEHNLSNNYDSFATKVIRHSDKIAPNDLVAIYIGTLMDRENYYQHPSNPNILVANGKRIDIDGRNFESFFSHFDRNYTPQELNRFTEISDRLVEDTKRRRDGEFYTPTPFVDYAHKMLSSVLGEQWKTEYIVWDNCWGTGNLTRDYRFNNLFVSNVNEGEMQIGERYNHEASKFLFDFLNDELEPNLFDSKIPEGLHDALEEDKPFVFFLNPPYARNSGDNNVGTSEEVCFTKVRTEMNAANMGVCVSNTYGQFLFRINTIKKKFNLHNVYIGLFSPTLYLSGESWKKFRADFLSNFEFIKACTFKASYFADVSPSWGIAFSIWKAGETANKETFPHTLIDLEDGAIIEKGEKNIYNIDSAKTASVWVREETKNLRTEDNIELTSAIKVREKDGARKGKLVPGALGYFYNKSNNVDKNTMGISLFSTAFSDNVGTSIIPENFHKVVTLFSARKLISKDWINSKDEYLAPNESHEKWEEFYGDSIVFSLFHGSGNQSSLRKVEYKGRLWNVKNEFFYMSKNDILSLAESEHLNYTYDDARTDNDRYVYETLKNISLSHEAKAVLDKAIDLTKQTFPYRSLFDQEHPEYQIKNWDCGWYQIKAMIKSYIPTELDAFNKLFKVLSDKMRPMVYELGFLK